MISPGAFPLFHSPFFLRLSLSLVLVHLGREGNERVSARLSLALAACHLHLQLAARGASRCTLRRRGQQQSPRRQALSTGSSWGRYTHNPHLHTHTHALTRGTHGAHLEHTPSRPWGLATAATAATTTTATWHEAETEMCRYKRDGETLATNLGDAVNCATSCCHSCRCCCRCHCVREGWRGAGGGGSCVPLWPQLASSAVHFQDGL